MGHKGPVQTPQWNLNGLLRYKFDVGPGSMALQADGMYRDKHFFALTNLPTSTEGDSSTTAVRGCGV